MKDFIAACAQYSITPNDIKANIAKSVDYIERAATEYEADLVVVPETVTTGFVTNLEVSALWDLVSEIPGPISQEIQRVAASLGIHVVWPTYSRGRERGVVYNSSALIGPRGEIIGVYHKTHPFPSERCDYGGWTTRGTYADVYETELGTIGMIICYDGDFPELSRLLAIKGAEVITRPSALLRSFDIWNLTTSARAYDNHVYMVAANAVGPDAGSNYYFGHSMIVNPIAWRLAQARGGEEIIAAKLSADPLKYVTTGSHAPQVFDHLEDRNIELYEEILKQAKSRFEIGTQTSNKSNEPT